MEGEGGTVTNKTELTIKEEPEPQTLPEDLEKLPEGTKVETLYEENPEEQRREPWVLHFTYNYHHFLNWILFKLSLGSLLLAMVYKKKNLFYLIACFYVVYHFVRLSISLNFYYKHRTHVAQMVEELHFDIFYSIGLIVTAMGWVGYFFGFVEASSIFKFCIPHTLKCMFNLIFSNSNNSFSVTNPLYAFCEGLQLTFIFYLFGQKAPVLAWRPYFVFYNISFNFLQIIGYFFIAIGVSLCAMIAIKYFSLSHRELLAFFLCACACFVGAVEFSYPQIILTFFIDVFDKGLLSSKGSAILLPAGTLSLGGQLTAIYAFFGLALICFYRSLMRAWIGVTKKNSIKTISLMTFPQAINSGYNQISETFFQKKKSAEAGASCNSGFDICTICLTEVSNVILQPCGHSGYCHLCITTWIKQTKNCPTCKLSIDQILVVVFDQESNQIMSTGIIKIA